MSGKEGNFAEKENISHADITIKEAHIHFQRLFTLYVHNVTINYNILIITSRRARGILHLVAVAVVDVLL